MAKGSKRDKAIISGPARVAVLMLALGDELAATVLAHLDEKEVSQIGNQMSFMDAVTPIQIENVSQEFFDSLEGGMGGILRGGSDYLRKMLLRNMDPDKVNELLGRITASGGTEELSGGLEAVRHLEPKTLASFLKNEHPQTCSIILAHLEGPMAAETLKLLPDRFQSEVILRVATLDRVGPGVLKDLDTALAVEFQSSAAAEGSQLGGVEKSAEIVNSLDHNLEVTILSDIESTHPELAENIRQLMFVFEDLTNVDDRGMQTILKEVNNEDLLPALKTASETLKEKLFTNMSKRAATMLQEDLSSMGPVKLGDVEKAQQSIIRTVKGLEEEGKIVLAAGGEELV